MDVPCAARDASQAAPTPQRELLFHYPCRNWIEALRSLAAGGSPDPHLGHALEFTNPTRGGAVAPTIRWLDSTIIE